MQKKLNPIKMAESEGIQTLTNQAEVQVVTSVMIALRDRDVGSQPATTANLRVPLRQRHGGPAL